MSSRKNPFEKRIERLEGHWEDFTSDPDARVLRWLVTDDDFRMVEAFIECEAAGGGEVADLFVRFRQPFGDWTQYGDTLVAGLVEAYQKSAEELEEEDLPLDWAPPQRGGGEADHAWVARTFGSFQAHFGDLMEHLAVVLTPDGIQDQEMWQRWLAGLAQEAEPTVRVLILDQAEQPRFEPLAKTYAQLVRSEPLDLEMDEAIAQAAKEGQDPNDPGAQFRNHFVALTNAAGKGDLAKVEASGRQALDIARSQEWNTQQVAVWMALGSAFLGQQRAEDAVKSYRAARAAAEVARTEAEAALEAEREAAAAAEDADQAGPPVPSAPELEPGAPEPVGEAPTEATAAWKAASNLVVQTRLAEGTVLLQEGALAAAAALYRETAQVAAEAALAFLTMESWRMAAYCHESERNDQESWTCAWEALAAAEALDPEMRATSTLPFVGAGLLRITDRSFPGHDGSVRERMVELVGPDWEQRAQITPPQA